MVELNAQIEIVKFVIWGRARKFGSNNRCGTGSVEDYENTFLVNCENTFTHSWVVLFEIGFLTKTDENSEFDASLLQGLLMLVYCRDFTLHKNALYISFFTKRTTNGFSQLISLIKNVKHFYLLLSPCYNLEFQRIHLFRKENDGNMVKIKVVFIYSPEYCQKRKKQYLPYGKSVV